MPKLPSPISIRLDAETEQRLRRLAHQTGGTLSAVVREAVAEYGAAHEQRLALDSRPYDRLQHLIGLVNRQTNRSERTGAGLRAVLKANSRARRPR